MMRNGFSLQNQMTSREVEQTILVIFLRQNASKYNVFSFYNNDELIAH